MKIKKTLLISTLVIIGINCSFAANTPAKAVKKPIAKTKKTTWENQLKGTNASFGAVVNTGNTSSQNVNLAFNPKYTPNAKWIYTGQITYQFAHSSDKGVTGNKTYIQGQAQYNLAGKNFLYTQVSYTNDKFDGYSYILNENLGYGYQLLNNDSMNLSLYGGPGSQQNKLSDTGVKSNLFSFQAGADYVWHINDKTDLTENFQNNLTKQNINSSSTTSLVTTLTNTLAFKVSFNLTNDTKPADGKKHINTTTTLSLVYNI